MKALSIRQPWAHLITNRVDHGVTLYPASGQDTYQERFDFKDVENRTWRTKYRGELLIHAIPKLDDADDAANRKFEQLIQIERPQSGLSSMSSLFCQVSDDEDLRFGGIVGIVELWDCVDRDIESPWWDGQGWGWRLRFPKVLPFSPLKGKLGFFNVEDADLRDETLEMLRLWRSCR